MFEQNEKVCVLNEFGQYIPCIFQEYIDNTYCQVLSENADVVTEPISRVIKLEEFLVEINRQISECYAMVDHFIATNNKSEINAWRKILQANKLQKRRLLKQ